MSLRIASMPEADRRRAVAAFDARYGELDRVLWCLSVHARPALLAGRADAVVDALLWTVKSWWAVQGVRAEWRPIFGQALAALPWSEEMFGPVTASSDMAEQDAVTRVEEFVRRSKDLGVSRREYSLGSKVLHWLQPWRIPIYDKLVRDELEIPTSWDHPAAYRRLVREILAETRSINEQPAEWVGSTGARSTLRGIDKCLWWIGGGEHQKAVTVNDPWRIVRSLGLDPNVGR